MAITRILLLGTLLAMISSPSRYWPRPGTIVASPTFIRRFITRCPTPAVRRMAVHLAVTLALHHQIAGDEMAAAEQAFHQ